MANVVTLATNVKLRNNRIYIKFKIGSKWIEEPFITYPKRQDGQKAAIEKAIAKLAEVQKDISINGMAFNLAKHFPNSSRISTSSKATALGVTFGHALEEAFKVWQDKKKGLSPIGTIAKDRGKADNVLLPAFGGKLIASITIGEIETWFATDLRMSKLSEKTKNNYMVVIRRVFEHAYRNNWVSTPLSASLESYEVDFESEADPFGRDNGEIDALISAAEDGTIRNMVQFALWSGLRVAEVAALSWEDIEFRKNGTARVFVKRQIKGTDDYQQPKNGRTRAFDQLKPAVLALKTQQAITALQPQRKILTLHTKGKHKGRRISESVRFVFLNPKTDEPFSGSNNMDRLWNKVIQAAHVRHRPMGQCRHTYASQCISHGLGLETVARNMGHSSTTMILKHYGKWIPNDSPDQSAMLNAAFGF